MNKATAFFSTIVTTIVTILIPLLAYLVPLGERVIPQEALIGGYLLGILAAVLWVFVLSEWQDEK